MTNIAPQAPDNNQRSWANLENYLRSLTLEGNEVHIISGVLGTGGSGSKGAANTISNGEINVPDAFWKVALILPNGSNDIQRVTTSTRVIAVLVPNDQDINTDWTQFKTTVDNIESLTGYDLFENLSDSVESVLEATVDTEPSV
ncbi:DNA/RNA non-specific endonuclease [Zobellia uliginosa]|uniref:DNA/RNA non-specific endonuclease n=1 Tax=Zobellia uliginosa TaxID=143224 RepID=UPI0026E13787|nr:DNA/RNA non-specific endonuclease [Zobellia uliginosa]MDO6518098.1 DNA/RNA non-specific endonuclease [Zobellia uliginosa]